MRYIVGSVALLVATMQFVSSPRAARSLAESTLQQPPFFYVGAKSCAGEGCHAATTPTEPARFPRSAQTEYRTWREKDKHSKAFELLTNELSGRITAHLGIPDATKSDRCLGCHSMHALPAERGLNFTLTDGVSCDGCHGPASEWLAKHALPGQSYEESLKQGMRNIRDPIVRAETCASCHVGNRDEGKIVDHELIAAGHPRLVFELDQLSRNLPPHWRVKPDSEDNVLGAQLWAVGQLVGAREEARLLANSAETDWPEYARFQCESCHHSLSSENWRYRLPQLESNAKMRRSIGRPAGRLDLLMVPPFERITNEQSTSKLVRSLDELEQTMLASPFGDAVRVRELAGAIEQQIVMALSSPAKSFSRDEARGVAAEVCRLGDQFAGRGPELAAQIANALDALLRTTLVTESNLDDRLAAVRGSVEPEYEPLRFQTELRALASELE